MVLSLLSVPSHTNSFVIARDASSHICCFSLILDLMHVSVLLGCAKKLILDMNVNVLLSEYISVKKVLS